QTLAEQHVRRQAGDVLTLEQHGAGVGLMEAGDEAEEGRLASAVGPYQPRYGAGAHVETAVIDGPQPPEVLDQASDAEQYVVSVLNQLGCTSRCFRMGVRRRCYHLPLTKAPLPQRTW